MAFDDIQTDSDSITSSEWNSMISYFKQSPPSGAQGWNSHNFQNSSLVWDDSLKKFKAMKSGGLNTQTTNALYPGSSNVNIKTSGSLHNLWNWSSNKGWYANSSNIRYRFKGSSNRWSYVSSQKISGGTIYTNDIYILGDTISGLRDPTYPSAAANKHYIDTISSNLDTKITTPTLSGPLAGNIGSNYTYGISGVKYASSQAISGQWRMPIYRTGKPTASATWDGRMIMSSGSTGNKARIWVCAKNDDGSTYDWLQISIGN